MRLSLLFETAATDQINVDLRRYEEMVDQALHRSKTADERFAGLGEAMKILNGILDFLDINKPNLQAQTSYGHASVTPSTYSDAKWQFTYFDHDMRPTGHMGFNTYREAAKELLISPGHRITDIIL